MSQSTRPLGLRSTPEFALPQFSNWKTELRVVTTNDSDKDAIVDANQIILCDTGSGLSKRDGSRFGLNTIVLLVDVTGAGGTVKLYIKEGTKYYLVRSDAVTADCVLTYTNLPPLRYVVEVTGLAGADTITLHGGGTY
jgi:hypothetical protein